MCMCVHVHKNVKVPISVIIQCVHASVHTNDADVCVHVSTAVYVHV